MSISRMCRTLHADDNWGNFILSFDKAASVGHAQAFFLSTAENVRQIRNSQTLACHPPFGHESFDDIPFIRASSQKVT